MTVKLSNPYLPGADVPNSLAEAQQANNEDFAQAIPDSALVTTTAGSAQWGTTTVAVSAGENDYTISLSQAWATTHMLFLAAIWAQPDITWPNVTFRGAQPASLSAGTIHLALGASGHVDVRWFSIGH